MDTLKLEHFLTKRSEQVNDFINYQYDYYRRLAEEESLAEKIKQAELSLFELYLFSLLHDNLICIQEPSTERLKSLMLAEITCHPRCKHSPLDHLIGARFEVSDIMKIYQFKSIIFDKIGSEKICEIRLLPASERLKADACQEIVKLWTEFEETPPENQKAKLNLKRSWIF